jgi:histone-lysine N-methyltransferase SETMAR
LLDEAQKNHRKLIAIEMPTLRREQEETGFNGIATGDESWLLSHYDPRAMFATAREHVSAYVRTQLGVEKTRITVFFTAEMLNELGSLPQGTKFNHKFFVETVFRGLMKEKRRFSQRNPGGEFIVHLDNSACHDGQKITSEVSNLHIIRTPHPPYSPDLSPCDCSLFGFLRESMKDEEFSTDDQLLDAITTIRNALTFETLQSVFREWVSRLS